MEEQLKQITLWVIFTHKNRLKNWPEVKQNPLLCILQKTGKMILRSSPRNRWNETHVTESSQGTCASQNNDFFQG